ncbi:hypothetical protein [Nonomuraea lactucae]|uniref:hypothetical protein n=1 Tax=Nonomuraea lactucae TaxID=2249762 RepID=UPI000DE4BAAF|nr:hypothetical protein [Nonomuraea lactucae]
MDFWRTIVGLARRPSVGPPIIALAVVAAVAAFLAVPARYTASVILLLTAPGNALIPPNDPGVPPGRTNPLLQDNAGLRTTAATLILATGTPEVLARLGASKDGPDKLVIDGGATNPALFGTDGPFLSIVAESRTAAGARALVERAQRRVQEELTAKQRELRAPAVSYITTMNVTPPSTPERRIGDKVQAAGVAFALALVAGFSAAYARLRLRARDQARPGPEHAEPEDEPEEPEVPERENTERENTERETEPEDTEPEDDARADSAPGDLGAAPHGRLAH